MAGGPTALGTHQGWDRREEGGRGHSLCSLSPSGAAAAPVKAPTTRPGKRLKLILVPEAARVTHRVHGLQALAERPTLRLISRAASFVTSR